MGRLIEFTSPVVELLLARPPLDLVRVVRQSVGHRSMFGRSKVSPVRVQRLKLAFGIGLASANAR